MNIKNISTLAIALGLLTACATTPAPAPVVKTTLGEVEFKQLADAAYYADKYVEREQKFSSLMVRDDLTPTQHALTYWYRGTSRGVWVNDGPYASPYCSVEDLQISLNMAPEHPKKQSALENLEYQKSRYQYFTRPESCGN